MILSLLLLLTPTTLEARHLEVDHHGWRAQKVTLVQGTLRLRARAAQGIATDRCPDGDIRLTGPLQLDQPIAQARADAATLCLPERALTTDNLAIDAPQLRLRVGHARYTQTHIQADEITASRCGCADPPWHVTARHAEVTLGARAGLWADWPVFWAGPIPVMTAPRWYIPLARRRTGLLAPELGWDGEDGIWGRQPFFWALHRSLDLTLSPGYRQGHGLGTDARLRWASTPYDGGQIDARWLLDEGLLLQGRGGARVGPARFYVDGVWHTDDAPYIALNPGLHARARDHLAGTIGIAIAHGDRGVGISTTQLRDRQSGEPVLSPTPHAWFAWTAPWGPISIQLDGQYLRLDGPSQPIHELLDLELTAQLPVWLGPIRLRPISRMSTLVHTNGPGAGQYLVGTVGGEAEIAIVRQGEWQHSLHLILDATLTDVHLPRFPPKPLLPIDRPAARRAIGVTLSSRWISADAYLRIDLRQGYEARAPVEGTERPQLTAQLDSPHVGLTVDMLPDALWARARLGALDAPSIELGILQATLTPDHPWSRARSQQRAWQLRPSDFHQRGADLRFTLPIDRLRLDVAMATDGRNISGAWGSATWRGRCDCWHLKISANQETGRDDPDLFVTLGL